MCVGVRVRVGVGLCFSPEHFESWYPLVFFFFCREEVQSRSPGVSTLEIGRLNGL